MASSAPHESAPPGASVAGEAAAEWTPLETLLEWPANPKDHSGEHVEQLRASIDRFGWLTPLVANRSTKTLIAGHGRRLAAIARGDELVPVRFVDLSEEDAELAALADNRLNELAGYDDSKLGAVLRKHVDRDREGLRLAGYFDDSLRDALRRADLRNAPPPGEDQGPAPESLHEKLRSQWGTELGQIWKIAGRNGEHRLIVGDSTHGDVVARLCGDERAECCWVDPPYGVDYVGGNHNQSVKWRRDNGELDIKNDAKTPEELCKFIEEILRGVREVCLPRSAVYIAHPAGALSLQFWLAARAAGLQIAESLVWVKDSMVMGHSDYHFKHEPVLLAYTPGDGRAGRGTDRWYGDNKQVSVFEIPRPKRSEEHPTMKPVELVEAMIKNSVSPGGLVYDASLGSGTTMVAAEKLGMRCIGCELDPKYAAVILDRMSKMGCAASLAE
jgi:DNA modification methylase